MQKLAENKWIGDLLLALVDMYGAKRDATLENSDIVTLLAALRQAGLYEEADALAAELMVQAAGRLSLADPTRSGSRRRSTRNWFCHERCRERGG